MIVSERFFFQADSPRFFGSSQESAAGPFLYAAHELHIEKNVSLRYSVCVQIKS